MFFAKMEDESLRVRSFDAIPSAEEFVSQIESKNVPAVFIECVKNWEVFCTWNFSNGGLDYLQRLVGSTTVEAMLSKSAPVFYGDIRSHERVPLPFSTFIGYCKELYRQKGENRGLCSESDKSELQNSKAEQDYSLVGEAPQQPTFLETKTLASINLWMNSAQTRSACILIHIITFYVFSLEANKNEEAENDGQPWEEHKSAIYMAEALICIMAPFCKSSLISNAFIWRSFKSQCRFYRKPDLSVHPRAEQSIKYLQRVVLHAGDALFIPECWFHQVDSDKLTIAVNFWWRSEMMQDMSEHMDAYYLHRILKSQSLQTNAMAGSGQCFFTNDICLNLDMFASGRLDNEMLHKTSSCESKIHSNEKSDNDSHDLTEECNVKSYLGNKVNQGTLPHDLDSSSLRSLHDLISLVHDCVSSADVGQAADSASGTDSSVVAEGEGKKFQVAELYCLEDDPVANFLWALQPLTLQKMFLAMAHHFPRTLDALVLHLLSPVVAEVLTRKFDEIDELNIEEDGNEFYQIFYGVFDDQSVAMDALLNGKELFAHQAFQNVLDQYLGDKV